jgi:hypothetical protein
MNLQDVSGLKDLYPPLRTRSKVVIKTTEPVYELKPEGLLVTVKTLFPPSQRRRVDLLVTANAGDLHVRPLTPSGMADAQRFAQLLRDRCSGPGQPPAPLRLFKDAEARCTFVIGQAPSAPAAASASPTSKASKPTAEKGAA